MKKTRACLVAALFIGLATASNAAEPLVDAPWVKANLNTDGIVFLDVRGASDFDNGHIPGAIHTSYGGWRVTRGGVRGLLPPADKLEALIGGLGIDNGTHVVLIAEGYSAGDMAKAARLYWTFKVLGHDGVSILNGGMLAYARDRTNPLGKGRAKPRPKTFKATLRPQLLATAGDVQAALDGGILVDNRSADQYLGINKSGSVKRRGTLGGARNVPGAWLTEEGGGVFRDARTIRRLYEIAGVPTKGPAINFCNTGHWASLGWFVSREILGNKDAKMYDGSMAEWTRDDANPVARRVKMD